MMQRHAAAALLTLALSTGAATDAQAQPPDYTFVNVGHLGGGYSYPYGVNEAGQVAVYSRTADGRYHAALYSGGTLTDLTPGAYESWPEFRTINEAGHVYGRVRWTSSSCGYQAFLYYAGTARAIPTGDCDTYIRKMNKWGQVVGTTYSSGVQRAFVYTPTGPGGTLQIISLGGNYAYAYDINDAGVVVGEARLPNGQTRAFRHDAATGVTADLGALGGSYSTARDVNESGQIAGTVQTPSGNRAFRWTAGTMEVLATLPGGNYSEGIWIDAAGWVIGRSNTAAGQYRVFRTNGSTAEPIDPPTATTGYPSLATDTGKVAGYFYPSGVSTYRTFVFTGSVSHTFSTGGYTYPHTLSDAGHAAGRYYVNEQFTSYVGFVFNATIQTFQTVSLGGSYTYIDDINNGGWAVGWGALPVSGTAAFLTNGSQTFTLASLVVEPAGAQLYEARHITDSGLIAGYGVWDNAGKTFLLVPGSTDTTAPTSTAAAEPLPNGAGWANADVTVTITAEDEADGSGVKEIVYSAAGAGAVAQTVVAGDTAALVVGAEGETTITYFARDNDGNEEAPKTLTVRVDKTAPSLTCATADGLWHGANVSLGCTAADPVSGLASPSDAAFTLTTSVAADTESANASTDSRIVCDLAGNCGTAGPIAGNKIDRKTPEIALTSPAAVNYALHQAVAADFACADTGSGIGSCTAPVASSANVDTATAGAKTFTVTATDAAGNTATASVTYTVLKGTPSVTWAAPAPIVYGTPLGAAQLNASSAIAGTFVYTPAAGQVLGAGTQALSATFTPDDTASYDPVTTGNSIEVTPAALTVTADSVSKAYGAALPPFTATTAGFVNGDTLASLAGSLTFDTTATVASPVATYPITPGGLSSPNYTVAFVPGTLTITPAPLVVTADAATKTYGAPLPDFTASFSGLVNGDAVASFGGVTFTTPATAGSAVGTYPITPGGVSSANYTVSFVEGTLTVTRAALTVTAQNATKVYGEANPAFSATIAGFVNADDEGDLGGTLSYATAANAASGVGSYAVTPSGVTSPNYTVTFVDGTLTVTPATLTVTAAPASKVYGAAMPTFTATYAGFVAGDNASDLVGTLTFATAATTGSGVGAYPVTPGGLTSANYGIAFVDGTLTVTPAPLVITANNQSMVLNGTMPALTVSYGGFVNGDGPGSLGVAPTVTTDGTGTAAGVFAIVPGGAAAANYAIGYVNGTLTVGYALAGNCLAGPGRTILQPLNVDGTSVFKRGSTVPAKFRVCDANGVSVSAAGTIALFRLIQTQAGTVTSVNEPVESTTPFNEFRWDATGQHWIFNMSTKGLSANTTYTYRVSLADGTWLDFRFGLR
jgi:probable HAF family extracellular repeat protein